jgi:hypothetical protein
MPAHSWSVCCHGCGGRAAARAAAATRCDISVNRRGETQTPIQPSPQPPSAVRRGISAPPDEDRDRRLRRRPDRAGVDGEELTMEGHLFTGQQGSQQLQRLVRTCALRARVDAAQLQLAPIVSAHSDPEAEAARGDQRQGRQLPGDDGGMTERQQIHRGLHGYRRMRRQERRRLDKSVGAVAAGEAHVVAHRQMVQSGVDRQTGQAIKAPLPIEQVALAQDEPHRTTSSDAAVTAPRPWSRSLGLEKAPFAPP